MARRQPYIFVEESHRGRSFLIGLAVVLFLLTAVLFTRNFTINHTGTFTKEYVTFCFLPTALENWTFLLLSDLNGEEIGAGQSAIRTAIGTRSYSCVVLSGNMVGEKGDVQPMLDLVSILPAGVPVLLLPGDSDPPLYASTAHSSLSAYADWAQRLQAVSFQRKDETIWFVPETIYTLNLDSAEKAYQDLLDGLNAQVEALTPDQAALKRNCEFQIGRMQRIREKIASIKADHIQVAVSHMPLTQASVAESRLNSGKSTLFSMNHVALVLSGGYCGGQWRIPGLGAVYVPELGFFPEDSRLMGLNYLGGVWQHISPGLGASSEYPFMPFRLFNAPGATMLVLTNSVY